MLDDYQKDAIKIIVENIKNKKSFTCVGGYAGTGKSYILAFIKKLYPEFGVGAYTGKAASVLRSRGIKDATTLHSLLYNVETDYVTDDVVFIPKSESEIRLKYKGFFIDEGSMVPKAIHDDLIKYGLPVIYFGDHGQLPPIADNFNLMEDPEIRLEIVHRNAGDIAKFAEWLRFNRNPYEFKKSDVVTVVNKRQIDDDHLVSTDQNICAYNKTRVRINKKIRRLLGYDENNPVNGDKVICLKNNHSLGIYNGQQGIIKNLDIKEKFFDFDTQDSIVRVRYKENQFNEEKSVKFEEMEKDINYFDYSYCITCHKSQADQFNNLIVLSQNCELWEMNRWNYTAASRAKHNIIFVDNY